MQRAYAASRLRLLPRASARSPPLAVDGGQPSALLTHGVLLEWVSKTGEQDLPAVSVSVVETPALEGQAPLRQPGAASQSRAPGAVQLPLRRVGIALRAAAEQAVSAAERAVTVQPHLALALALVAAASFGLTSAILRRSAGGRAATAALAVGSQSGPPLPEPAKVTRWTFNDSVRVVEAEGSELSEAEIETLAAQLLEGS